ncbi:MAG: esterase/lipase family protein, partial [Hydrogenophaga sp.]
MPIHRPVPTEYQSALRPGQWSALARLQQWLVGVALGATLVWLAVFLPDRPGWALIGPLLLVSGHAVVLGLEFALAAWVNRGDAAAPASFRQWLGAWWQEVKAAPVVFAWRQPFRWKRCPDDAEPVPGDAATVVLVHGFVCNRGLWTPWMTALRSSGLPYVSVNLEPVFGSIEAYVPVIEAAVCRAERLGGGPPVLVGHSMGGLAI